MNIILMPTHLFKALCEAGKIIPAVPRPTYNGVPVVIDDRAPGIVEVTEEEGKRSFRPMGDVDDLKEIRFPIKRED